MSDVACIACDNTFPKNDMVPYGKDFVCGECKDGFFQGVKEGTATNAAFQFGGFWIRAGALILDSIITTVINYAILIPITFILPAAAAVMSIVLTLVMLFWEPFFVAKYAATPGKMICGLEVLKADGSRLSFWQAILRSLAKILSSLILLIGYIMAAFDDEKRGLHDRLCNTRVVKK